MNWGWDLSPTKRLLSGHPTRTPLPLQGPRRTGRRGHATPQRSMGKPEKIEQDHGISTDPRNASLYCTEYSYILVHTLLRTTSTSNVSVSESGQLATGGLSGLSVSSHRVWCLARPAHRELASARGRSGQLWPRRSRSLHRRRATTAAAKHRDSLGRREAAPRTHHARACTFFMQPSVCPWGEARC